MRAQSGFRRRPPATWNKLPVNWHINMAYFSHETFAGLP